MAGRVTRWQARRMQRHVRKHGFPDAAYARKVTAKRKHWLRTMWFVVPFLIALDAFQWALYVRRPTTVGLVWAVINTGLMVFAALMFWKENRTFHRMLASIDSLEVTRMDFRERLIAAGMPVELAELVDRFVMQGNFGGALQIMTQFDIVPRSDDLQ